MLNSDCYIDKYTPTSLDQLIGHDKEIQLVRNWINNFKNNIYRGWI